MTTERNGTRILLAVSALYDLPIKEENVQEVEE